MRIGLINMPFADIRRPSIALAQLRSVLEEQFQDEVKVEEFFFYLELAEFLGPEIYEYISLSGPSNSSGFGDWFFRQEAFPELEDNSTEYFERYGHHFGKEAMEVYEGVIRHKRKEVGDLLDHWVHRYRLHEYDMIGFTSMFMQNVPSFALARRIKALHPSGLIIMGGANCESPMGEEIAKNVSYIDYVFSGNALKSLPAFVSHCLAGEREQCERINGVFSRKNCGPLSEGSDPSDLKLIAPVGQERPVNEVVEVSYDQFLDTYEDKFSDSWKEPYLLFETSRGCWWGAKAHCTFCGLNGGNMGYRAIAAPKALALLKGLFDRYAHRVNHFSCVDNIIPKEYFTDVFPLLEVPENVSIFYEVKADLTEEQMQILSDTHISQIQPGIESLDTTTLKLMRKGTTSFGNIRLLKYCLLYNIEPIWNLLIGFPGEQEETYIRYARILPNLYHLPPPSGIFPVRFDRYSPYFTRAEEYKLDLHPLDYYSFIYPFDRQTIARMAYYFTDHNYNSDYNVLAAKWIHDLKMIVDTWLDRWKYPEAAPRLFISNEEGRCEVIDTRSGQLLKYPLTPAAESILAALGTHKNTKALMDDLSHLPETLITSELAYLFAKGLVFEEKGSMLSLIVNVDNATLPSIVNGNVVEESRA